MRIHKHPHATFGACGSGSRSIHDAGRQAGAPPSVRVTPVTKGSLRALRDSVLKRCV